MAGGAEGAEDPLAEPSGHPMQKQSQQSQMYGYLGYATNVVLGVEDVTRLVEVVADELGRRGECFCLALLFGLLRFLFSTFFFYSLFFVLNYPGAMMIVGVHPDPLYSISFYPSLSFF